MANIAIARKGGVLTAAFDRPDKKNAITGAMYEALIAAFEEAERDDTVGAMLLSGCGGVFTAGNDIGDFLGVASRSADSGPAGEFPAGRFIKKLAAFGKPLVAAVEGLAIGIGTTLCFHCDLVYATPDARFQMPFVNLGLMPEAGSSLLAPLRFGYAKAAEYLMLGEPFSGESARDLGLVNETVEAAQLLTLALHKAEALAAKPRAAILATRRLMRGDPTALETRMAAETEAFRAALASPEARGAFQAFAAGGKR